jgi:hypothetical protein
MPGFHFVTQHVADLTGCPDKELALFPFAAIAPGAKRSGIGILRAVESPRPVKHVPHDVVQNLLRNGTEELVPRHLPGMDVEWTRASWELSYNIRSKWGVQSDTPGFPLTARLVMDPASSVQSVR